MAAYRENALRVNIEFLRANQPGQGRIIRLNHTAAVVPPQLQGRVSPEMWAAFMQEVNVLASHHPYTQKPSGSQVCNWAACFAIGAVVGLFCVNPDGGDYNAWFAEAEQLVQRFAPAFGAAGCGLSLQRGRENWIQIDVDPSYAVGQPVMGQPMAGMPPAKTVI